MSEAEMTFDEMRDLVSQANYVEFLYQQSANADREREQRNKAPEILMLLRQCIPADRRHEVEEFLGTGFGSRCLQEVMDGKRDPDKPRQRHSTDDEWPPRGLDDLPF